MSTYYLMLILHQWGKDKTPNPQAFDPNQAYSPQSAQAPGFPGTPSQYFPQYGGKLISCSLPPFNFGFANELVAAQYGQQGNYGGPAAQSPAGYGPQMGFNGPPSAGGYGRGQQAPNAQWAPPQGPNAGYGYQG